MNLIAHLILIDEFQVITSTKLSLICSKKKYNFSLYK